MLDHIGGISDGHLVKFPHSTHTFMKVCTRDGLGGVVDITTGELIMTTDLLKQGLDVWCSECYGERIDIQYEVEDEIPDDVDESNYDPYIGCDAFCIESDWMY